MRTVATGHWQHVILFPQEAIWLPSTASARSIPMKKSMTASTACRTNAMSRPIAQNVRPRKVMQQAASDLEQGLVGTDRHAQPGVEKVKPAAPQQARPDAQLEPKKAR